MPASTVFIGKWVTVRNAATGGVGEFDITISSSGPANGTVVPTNGAALFQTNDGTNWFLVASNPRRVQVFSSTMEYGLIAPGATVSLAAPAVAGLSIVGGGFRVTATPAASPYNVVDNFYDGSRNAWVTTLANASTGNIQFVLTVESYSI
jgi:hypothetical protein